MHFSETVVQNCDLLHGAIDLCIKGKTILISLTLLFFLSFDGAAEDFFRVSIASASKTFLYECFQISGQLHVHPRHLLFSE